MTEQNVSKELLFYGILLILLGIDERRKKNPTRFQISNEKRIYLNGRPIKEKTVDKIKKEEGIEIIKKYSDYFCYLGGIVCILGYLLQMIYYEYCSLILLVYFILAGIILILLFYGNVWRNKDVKRIKGYVKEYVEVKNIGESKEYYLKIRYYDYGIEQEYLVKYAYSKKNLPKIGTEYILLYSYVNQKMISEFELHNRKKAILLFVIIAIVCFVGVHTL